MAFKKAIFKDTIIEYISPNDPDKSNPTVFTLGAISAENYQIALSELVKYKKTEDGFKQDEDLTLKQSLDYNKKLCIYGIKEVKNLEGYEWKGKVNDELINTLIQTGLLYEIGQEVSKLNTLGEEVKN